MTLLARARAVGLTVTLDATGEIRVRGPRRAELVAKEVLAHGDVVRDELRRQSHAVRRLRDDDLVLVPGLARAGPGALALPDLLEPAVVPIPGRGPLAGPSGSHRARRGGRCRRPLFARLLLEALTTPLAAEIAPVIEERTVVEITRTLAVDGWIVVWSPVLDAEIVLVTDESVVVPGPAAALPRFDQAELAVLAVRRPHVDHLRAICDVKREMPGSRVVEDTEPST